MKLTIPNETLMHVFKLVLTTAESLYIPHLIDWHTFMLLSKGTYFLVKKYLVFDFDVDDQWVYSQIREYGQHALYHAHKPYTMERVFHLVGYTTVAVEIEQCDFCNYRSRQCYRSPLMNAIAFGKSEHLQNIINIGFSTRDVDPWEDLKFTWVRRDHDTQLCIIKLLKTVSNNNNIFMLDYFLGIGCNPEIIGLMKSADIDINYVDEEGNNFMFYSIWKAPFNYVHLKYLYDAGFDFARKNNQGDDILGSVERSLNNYNYTEQDVDGLGCIYCLLHSLRNVSLFKEREGIGILIQRIAELLMELEGG